jgi:hypothetical protein
MKTNSPSDENITLTPEQIEVLAKAKTNRNVFYLSEKNAPDCVYRIREGEYLLWPQHDTLANRVAIATRHQAFQKRDW